MANNNDVEYDRSCCEKCSFEFNELCCKPKARCFKGLAILSSIYTLGCALMLLFIPPVVESHGYDEGSSVDDNLHKMKLSSIILLVVFFCLSLLNLMACKFYDRREKRHE
mmetsp:Transcript_25052/g.31367  ORF Transcript_25052/g.31367 Transcript_25052/m.31367 type:complete len:110 (-) Transcript_25052:247-576(-)